MDEFSYPKCCRSQQEDEETTPVETEEQHVSFLGSAAVQLRPAREEQARRPARSRTSCRGPRYFKPAGEQPRSVTNAEERWVIKTIDEEPNEPRGQGEEQRGGQMPGRSVNRKAQPKTKEDLGYEKLEIPRPGFAGRDHDQHLQ